MSKCMICNENEAYHDIVLQEDWELKRNKEGKIIGISNGIRIPRTILFEVCLNCLKEQGTEVAKRTEKTTFNAKYPLGLFRGNPIHEMTREELAEVIRFLEYELIMSGR